MTSWELRQIIEGSMPWWAPAVIAAVAIGSIECGRWAFSKYGNRLTDWIERKRK